MSSNRETDPVAVVVDRILIGYLSAVTKEDPSLVMCNLRDLATAAVDRLKSRTYGYNTWGNVDYPGIALKLRVTVKHEANNYLWSKTMEEHRQRFEQETGLSLAVKGQKKAERNSSWNKYYEWVKANPVPSWSHGSKWMMAYFKIAKSSDLMMTQDEIDTVLVEQILLLPTESENHEQ